jgi:hypothetical protein
MSSRPCCCEERRALGRDTRQLCVWAVADLLDHERHDLVRDADEADDD